MTTLFLFYPVLLLALGVVVMLAESRAKNGPGLDAADGNCLVLVLNERNLRSQLDIKQRLEPAI